MGKNRALHRFELLRLGKPSLVGIASCLLPITDWGLEEAEPRDAPATWIPLNFCTLE